MVFGCEKKWKADHNRFRGQRAREKKKISDRKLRKKLDAEYWNLEQYTMGHSEIRGDTPYAEPCESCEKSEKPTRLTRNMVGGEGGKNE